MQIPITHVMKIEGEDRGNNCLLPQTVTNTIDNCSNYGGQPVTTSRPHNKDFWRTVLTTVPSSATICLQRNIREEKLRTYLFDARVVSLEKICVLLPRLFRVVRLLDSSSCDLVDMPQPVFPPGAALRSPAIGCRGRVRSAGLISHW